MEVEGEDFAESTSCGGLNVIDLATRQQVITRAANCCEYCRMPQEFYEGTFHIEHVLASQHVTDDSFGNLAWSCPRCNRKKGPNLAAIDPLTKAIVTLVHPRNDNWHEHFSWNGPILQGLTPIGRAAVSLLDMNSGDRVRLRQSLITEGVFPRT